jgi:HK97 family phage prohead protease
MDATWAHTGKPERRAVTRPLDVTDEGFGGLGGVYYDGTPATEARIAPDIRERFMPGCFRSWYASGAECLSLFDHNTDVLLGKRSQSLRLTENEAGLSYFVPYDAADPDHQRVRAKILRGDVRGSSIIFRPTKNGQRFVKDGGEYVRELTEVEILEIGPTPMPVYSASTAEARSGLYLPIEEIRQLAAAGDVDPVILEMEAALLL